MLKINLGIVNQDKFDHIKQVNTLFVIPFSIAAVMNFNEFNNAVCKILRILFFVQFKPLNVITDNVIDWFM